MFQVQVDLVLAAGFQGLGGQKMLQSTKLLDFGPMVSDEIRGDDHYAQLDRPVTATTVGLLRRKQQDYDE